MCDEILRMNVPSHQALGKILHLPDTGDPGTIDSDSVMYDTRARIELHRSPFAYEHASAPLPGRADS